MSAAWRSSNAATAIAGDFFEDFKQLIESRLHLAPILISKLREDAARHRQSELGRRRSVRNRPPHFPREPARPRGSRDARADRRLDARQAAQPRAPALGVLRLRGPEGRRDRALFQGSPCLHRRRGGRRADGDRLRRFADAARSSQSGRGEGDEERFPRGGDDLPRVLRRALAPSDRSRRPDQADRSAAHRQERSRLDPVRQCDGSDRADDARAQRPAVDRQDDERDRRQRRSIRNRARVWPA